MPSVEPSSTMTSSAVYGEASTRATISSIVSSSLKQGITTDRHGAALVHLPASPHRRTRAGLPPSRVRYSREASLGRDLIVL